MFKGFIAGIIVGILLVGCGFFFYFSTGRAPVATSASPMPFETQLARIGLHAYLDKQPHLPPAVPADETNLLAGAKVYKENCAVCHGLPSQQQGTAISRGMFPKPPQLFRGTGVTDDEPWETYWKAENGIRMSGMPSFKGRLTETQIWQVTMLAKYADKITPAVKDELVGVPAPPSPVEAKPEIPSKRAKPQRK